MPDFAAQDVHFKQVVQDSFLKQAVMQTFGASIFSVAPGRVALQMPYQASLGQQHGFLHAGVITTLLDSACGYAALSLMPAGSDVLSIEFKVNLLSPAIGELFTANAEVVRAGKTITVCRAQLEAHKGNKHKTVALIQATMMTIAKSDSDGQTSNA